MSELPEGIEPAPIPAPKPSALGIVLRRRSDGGSDVLLGRRARLARFMPGNLAFPGGKLEAADGPESEVALRRCASRELLEETGLAIPPDAWRDAGERTTPPIYAVRFRTRFFVADLPPGAVLPQRPPVPEEIESLVFADPGVVLAEWADGISLVPPPLLPILRRLQRGDVRDAPSIAEAIGAVNAAEAPCPRIEFVPGTWVFPVRTRTLPPASCTNVWMPGGRSFAIIDPGSDDDVENDRLLAVVERRSALGDSVRAVVLTHHHRDHVSGAGAIAAALGVPVLAHGATLERIPLPPSVATHAVEDGDALDLDGVTLLAVHTPGHAPGHLAFFEDGRRVLFGGDLVSGLSTILVPSGDGDMDAYLDALRRAAALHPRIVLPSHGPPLPGSTLAATIAHRDRRESAIIAALSDGAPRDLASIAEAAYADTPRAPVFLREMQTRAHLERLVRCDRVERAGERYRIPGISIRS